MRARSLGDTDPTIDARIGRSATPRERNRALRWLWQGRGAVRVRSGLIVLPARLLRYGLVLIRMANMPAHGHLHVFQLARRIFLSCRPGRVRYRYLPREAHGNAAPLASASFDSGYFWIAIGSQFGFFPADDGRPSRTGRRGGPRFQPAPSPGAGLGGDVALGGHWPRTVNILRTRSTSRRFRPVWEQGVTGKAISKIRRCSAENRPTSSRDVTLDLPWSTRAVGPTSAGPPWDLPANYGLFTHQDKDLG